MDSGNSSRSELERGRGADAVCGASEIISITEGGGALPTVEGTRTDD